MPDATDDIDEQMLIAAIQAGNRDAFAPLVRRHQRRALAVCRAILDTREDAEDAVQDGFLNAFRAIDRFRAGDPFGAWLHRIMVNASRDLRRRRAARPSEQLTDTLPTRAYEPADVISTNDLLRASIADLPDRQRAVLVLHDVEGFLHAEIGEMLDIPVGTARSDLHAARRKLRIALAPLRTND